MNIGIILPIYNAKSTILRTIESIIKQSNKNWVLYIIDDCSTDGSCDLIKKNYNDKRFVFSKNDINQGAAKTRNKGIEICSEDYICFIDSDDEWHPEKLSSQLKEIEAGSDFILTGYLYSKSDGSKNVILNSKGVLSENDFLKKKFRICFSSVCVKKNNSLAFKSMGHEDFDFLFQCFNLYKKARVINHPLAIYHETANSLSSDKVKAAKWHYALLRQFFPNNIIKQLYYFFWYIFRAFEFKFKVR